MKSKKVFVGFIAIIFLIALIAGVAHHNDTKTEIQNNVMVEEQIDTLTQQTS